MTIAESNLPMSIHCRVARSEDKEILVNLIVQLQEFHHLPRQTQREITRDIEQMPASFEAWIAENENDEVLGLALVAIYPGPGIAKGLYLKELFVVSASRRSGVGHALMNALARSACSRGFPRIDLVTTYENAKARAFYDGIGAKADESKVFYRLDADALSALAEEIPQR
nr:GNAT family N-acetyltransferase [uncultured Cohaesibacter sp.]